MTPSIQQQSNYTPSTDDVDVRAVDDDGRMYRITAPISSDQTARDGVSFSREKLEAFRSQINEDETPIPLMVDHGKSDLGGDAQYSVLGRVGTVEEATLERDGEATLLRAEMAVADPDALATEGDPGEIGAALRYLKYQAETMGLSFSVGWNEDSGRTNNAELLEVSTVAIPSDVTSSTAGAEPSEAVVRGLESLPNEPTGRASEHPNWGLTAIEETPPTDAERVTDALDELDHAREFRAPDPDLSTYGRRGGSTPEVLDAIEELCDALGYGSREVDVADRLDELRKDEFHPRRKRENALDLLDAIEDSVGDLNGARIRNGVRVYALGQSRSEVTARLTDAVDTVRDALTEDDTDDTPEGWGFPAPGGDA